MSLKKKMLSLAMVGALPLAAAMPGTAVADPDPWVGQMEFVPYSFNPRNWEFCNGQLLPVASYTALYSLLGTTYGGDGRSSFGLPDMRGRSPIGAGNAPGLGSFPLGQRSGFGQITLNANNMPAHTHPATAESTSTVTGGVTSSLKVNSGTGDKAPANNFLVGKTGLSNNMYTNVAPDATLNAGSITTDSSTLKVGTITGVTVQPNTGGGTPVNNYHPYLALNCIIALEGQYPSRN